MKNPRWAKQHMSNAEIVAAFLRAFAKDGDKLCTCDFCKLARKITRERRK